MHIAPIRAVALSAGLLTLWGCAAPQPAAAPAAGAGPVTPKVNRLVLAVEPTTAESNVLRQLSTTTAWPIFPMYEWLIEVDPATGKNVPMLSTGWKLEPDGASYRFSLRSGVRFHGDFGDFSAQDFAAAVAEKTKPDAQGQSVAYWRQLLDKVEVVTPQETVLRLKRPDSQFLDYVSRQIPGTEVFSKAAMDKLGEPTPASGPLPGTGSYQFKERQIGQYIRYERAPYKHWRVQPDFPEVEFRWMKEASTRMASLLAGEVQMASLPTDLQKQAESRGYTSLPGKVPGFRVFVDFRCCVLSDPKNAKSPFVQPGSPLEDKRVRKALSKAVNLEELNKGLFGGKGEIMYNNPFHPTRPGWNPDWQKQFAAEYGYDVAAAKSLLADAGFGPGNPLKVNSVIAQTQGFSASGDVIDALANYWRLAGLTVELVTPPSQQVQDSYQNHVVFRSTSSTLWGGIVNFGSNLASSGRQVMNVYEADEVLTEVGRTLDETKIEPLWKKEGDILFDAHKFLPLFWLPVEIVVDPKVVSGWLYPGSLTGNWTHLEHIKATR